MASESSDLRVLESVDQTLNSRICSERSCNQRTQEEDEMPGVQNKALEVSTHDSLEATIVSSDDSSSGIKAFPWKNCIELDLETQEEYRWEGIGELENAERGDEGCQAEEIRNRGSDDKGTRPVDWYERSPDYLSFLCGQRRCTEEVGEDIVVQDLDADIAIETSSNQCAEETDDVSNSLPGVDRNALERRIDGILSLIAVEEASVKDIDDVDERLSADHSLPEITGTSHLRHELGEQHGSAISIHSLHQTVYGTDESSSRGRKTGRMYNWWEVAISICCDRISSECCASRSTSCIIIWSAVSNNAHGGYHDKNIHPDCNISKPSVLL